MSSSKQDSNAAPLSGQVTGEKQAEQKSQIINKLCERLTKNVFDMWFDNGRSITVTPHRVLVSVDSPFLLNRIQKKYISQIEFAVAEACGPAMSFACVLNEADSSATDSTTSDETDPQPETVPFDKAAQPEAENIKKPVVRSKQGIVSFHFGQTNRLAQAGIEQMFAQPGQISPLMMYGPAGCGKTHLLQSIVVDARRKHRRKRCVMISSEQFTSNFVAALKGSGLPVFRAKYRDLDLLAIDDVQFFAGKKATLAEFLHTIDNLSRQRKQVVLSADRQPDDLSALGSDVTARMSAGLACPLFYPNVESRFMILKDLCKQRDWQIPDDVLDLIANKMARDVRRLSGAINRIHAYSVATGREPDIQLANDSLSDLFALNTALTSIANIEKAVCDFCSVKPAELRSSSRHKKICAARTLAMYLSRKYTRNAYSEIGEYFGRKHSTVIAANKKFSSLVEANEAIDLPNAKYRAKDALMQIEASLRIG